MGSRVSGVWWPNTYPGTPPVLSESPTPVREADRPRAVTQYEKQKVAVSCKASCGGTQPQNPSHIYRKGKTSQKSCFSLFFHQFSSKNHRFFVRTYFEQPTCLSRVRYHTHLRACRLLRGRYLDRLIHEQRHEIPAALDSRRGDRKYSERRIQCASRSPCTGSESCPRTHSSPQRLTCRRMFAVTVSL